MADNGIRPHTVHIETEAVTLDGTVRLTEEDHARGEDSCKLFSSIPPPFSLKQCICGKTSLFECLLVMK